ncbi:hypothetical protein D3C80_1735500 [compost metagenome]
MATQFALPLQFKGLGKRHRTVIELFSQELLLMGQGLIINRRYALRQLLEEQLHLFSHLCHRRLRRLYPELQPGLPVDLSDTAEYRVAQLQLDPQALIEGCLAQVSQHAPCGFVGQCLGGSRAKQQQRVLVGGTR